MSNSPLSTLATRLARRTAVLSVLVGLVAALLSVLTATPAHAAKPDGFSSLTPDTDALIVKNPFTFDVALAGMPFYKEDVRDKWPVITWGDGQQEKLLATCVLFDGGATVPAQQCWQNNAPMGSFHLTGSHSYTAVGEYHPKLHYVAFALVGMDVVFYDAEWTVKVPDFLLPPVPLELDYDSDALIVNFVPKPKSVIDAHHLMFAPNTTVTAYAYPKPGHAVGAWTRSWCDRTCWTMTQQPSMAPVAPPTTEEAKFTTLPVWNGMFTQANEPGAQVLKIASTAAASTTTTLSAKKSVITGQSLDLTSTTIQGSGSPVTTGKVQATVDGVPVGYAKAVTSNGTASLSVSGAVLPIGTHAVGVNYQPGNGLAPSKAAAASVIVTDGAWSFTDLGAGSRQLLEVNGAAKENGATVDTWDPVMSGDRLQANYLWTFQPADDDGSRGRLVNRASSKCLDYNKGADLVDQWTCDLGYNQQWRAVTTSTGQVLINQSNGKYLAITGGKAVLVESQSAATRWRLDAATL